MTSPPGMLLDPASGDRHPARRGDLRAADADREHAAAQLRQHLADGRLTVEEFGERLDQVSAARTLGDLARAQRELPDIPEPWPADPRSGLNAGGAVDPAERTALTRHLVVYLLANGLLVLVWLAGGILRGELGPFWPGWILLGWSVALLLHISSVMRRTAAGPSRALGPPRAIRAGRRAGPSGPG